MEYGINRTIWECGGGEAGLAPLAAVIHQAPPLLPEQLLRVRGTDWRRSRNVVCVEGVGWGVIEELGGKLPALQLALPILLGRAGHSGLHSPLAPFFLLTMVNRNLLFQAEDGIRSLHLKFLVRKRECSRAVCVGGQGLEFLPFIHI